MGLLSWITGKPKPGSKAYGRDALKREIGATMEAYKLARRDRPRESFQPHGYSGTSAIMGSHDLMNRRVRDLVRNTAQGKKIVRSIKNLVVGKGMQTFSWPFAPAELLEITTELDSMQQGELGPRLQFALESDDLFEEYFNDKDQFDAEGRLSGAEMYRMLIGEAVTVGNGLMVRTFRPDFDPDNHIVPVAWQMFEREQLDQSQDREAKGNENRIVGGLELDSRNRVVAYHLFLDHPHDYFGISSHLVSPSSNGKSVRVDANRVIDLALYDRPSSSLGCSWMDAVGQPMWDRDSYSESELRTAAVESVFALVAKIENGEQYQTWGFDDGLADEDEHGNREFKVGHSPYAVQMGKEESLEFVKPSRPNKDAGSFIRVIDHDIAGGAGISYQTLTGDYENTNFSSSRGAKLDEDLDIGPLQQWFGLTVALPVRRTFNALAVAGGRVQSLRPAEFRRNVRIYQRFDVIGCGRDLLDPFKEGEARTARLRTGMSTFKEECARINKHWIRVLMQQAIEKRVFSMFSVNPDWTKSGAGATSSSNGQSNEEGSADRLAEDIADRLSLLTSE